MLLDRQLALVIYNSPNLTRLDLGKCSHDKELCKIERNTIEAILTFIKAELVYVSLSKCKIHDK